MCERKREEGGEGQREEARRGGSIDERCGAGQHSAVGAHNNRTCLQQRAEGASLDECSRVPGRLKPNAGCGGLWWEAGPL